MKRALSCPLRGATVVPPAVSDALIVPKVAGWLMSLLGGWKLGWLKTFTKSARSSKPKRSLKWKPLASEKLKTDKRGPRKVFLPESPNVPFAGTANAAVLK